MRGLQRYLENANLTSLDLRDESFRNCWSQNAFLPISRYLNLNFLSILDIEDSWVVALDEYSKMASSFIALKYLYTGLSTAALSKLHKHTPNLTGITLLLESFSPSEIQNILLSASKFHENEFLQIKFPPWAIIEGADLINLGRNCPNLQSILLGDEQRFHPKAQGISDSAIETLARSMPQLENLYMPFDPRDTLTFKALRSLGRHCPNLQRLTLSADIDWSECVSGLMDILFPKLWKLTLWTSSAPALQFNDPGQETIETWASHLGDMMPKLTHFEIDNQVPMAETELALMNTMREMLDWRMFRKFRGEE
jgi:hypothetical protein